MRRHGVGELGVILDLLNDTDDFRRHLLVELHIALELVDHRARERLGLDLLAGDVFEHDGVGLVVVAAVGVSEHLAALRALDQHLDGAVRQLEQLQHAGERAGLIDRVGCRIVVGGVPRRQQNERVRAHHLFQRLDRLLAADEQRHDHVREDDDVAQRKHRVGPGFAWGERRTRLGECHWESPCCCAPPSWPAEAQPRWSAGGRAGRERSPPIGDIKQDRDRCPVSNKANLRTQPTRLGIRWIQAAGVSS